MFDAQFQENTKQLGEIEEKSPDTLGAFKEVEGMEIGRQQAIDIAASRTTVTGENIVSVYDVSSIPHDIKITVPDNTPVTVCGKNLAFRENIIASGAVEVGEDEYYIENPGPIHKKVIFKNDYNYTGVIHAGALFKYTGPQAGALINIAYTDGTVLGMSLGAIVDGQYHYNYVISAAGKVVDCVWWSYYSAQPAYIKDIQVGFHENKAFEKPFNIQQMPSNGEIVVKSKSPNITVLANAHISMDYRKSNDMETQKTEFMSDYQWGGERTNYDLAFSGNGWTVKNFMPLYDMSVTTGYMMFSRSTFIDLAAPFEKAGVSIQYVKNGQYMFFNSPNLTKVPIIHFNGLDNSPSAYGAFQSCPKLQSLHLILTNQSSDRSNYWYSTFAGCTSLKDVTFEGKITSSIDFKSCPLSVESAKNIILALENYRGTSYEEQFACYFSSAVWTLLDAEGAAHEGLTWREYLNAIAWNY